MTLVSFAAPSPLCVSPLVLPIVVIHDEVGLAPCGGDGATLCRGLVRVLDPVIVVALGDTLGRLESRGA